MHETITSDDVTLFLRNGRMGGILTADQLRSALEHLTERPPTGSYAIGVSAPNWLVDRFDATERLAQCYTVYPTHDRLDSILLATLQCTNAQLRCVMQLSDPLTNALVRDALTVGLLTMLFDIENTGQCAVVSVPVAFDDPDVLLRLLHTATRSTAGIVPAIKLTSLSCNPAFGQSLIDGQQVADVIAVLATTPTTQDLEMAGFAGTSSNAGDPRDMPLH